MAWEVMAALASAAAVLLALQPGPGRRLTGRPPARLPGWLGSRPGGLTVRQRGVAAGAAAAAVATWTGYLGWWVAATAPVAAGLVFLGLGRIGPGNRSGRRGEVLAGLAQACDLLAAAVEAGLPVRHAVEVVGRAVGGPVGEALGGVSAKVRLGVPEPQAWAEAGAEPGLEALARELARTVSTGVGVARLLRDLAAEGRRSAAAEAMVRARRVGVHSVLPVIACFLPSFLLLGIVPLLGGIVQTVLR